MFLPGIQEAAEREEGHKFKYVLKPVTGTATYQKVGRKEERGKVEPRQLLSVALDEVALCMSEVGWEGVGVGGWGGGERRW